LGSSGFALLGAITIMGPSRLSDMGPSWLAAFLLLLAATLVWWALYLWLLNRMGGLGLKEGLGHSFALLLLLALSLIPTLAVLLSGRLPYIFPFDEDMRSAYVWITGLLAFTLFVGQEAILAGAVRGGGVRGLLGDGLSWLSAAPGGIAMLPGWTVRQIRCHPLLAVILLAGIVQRWQIVNQYQDGDMNDMLSVVYSLLSWTPWGYYHYYGPQTYIFAHLPLFPMLIAPFYWFFQSVAHLPTPWAAKLVSAVADIVAAVLIYSQARGRWRGSWGLILAAAWLLSPVVANSDDRPVCVAATFAIAAMASRRRGWLCGALIALGVSTRTEVAFLALPLAIHFLFKRELGEKVSFIGAFVTTLGVVALPFILTDPAAIDFAMRLQGQRQASGELSYLLTLVQPHLMTGIAVLFQKNPSYFPTSIVLVTSLLAFRDRRVARVALVVAVAYIMSIPVLHPHYTVLSYATGIFYSALYGNPLVAVGVVLATWQGFTWGFETQVALVVALVVFGLLQLERRKSD
jgi:hypothetical protein